MVIRWKISKEIVTENMIIFVKVIITVKKWELDFIASVKVLEVRILKLKLVNYGKCVKVHHVKNNFDMKETENIPAPVLSKEEYDALPKTTSSGKDTCGNEFIDPISVKNNATADIKAGCTPNTCDNTATRNTYTSPPNRGYKMFWMVFKCADNWHLTAPTKISEATADINNRFSTIGIQFVSYITYYECSYVDNGVTKSYAKFPQSGTGSPASAVFRERGNNWQSLGGFVIVAGIPEVSGYNGWMYYPTSGTYSGIAFMNHRVIAAGATT